MLKSPASESSSPRMLRSEPCSASKEEPPIGSEVLQHTSLQQFSPGSESSSLGMLKSPASESSSLGMLRSEPCSASNKPGLCRRGCCSSPFNSVPRSIVPGSSSGSSYAELLRSPASLEDRRSVMNASTPSATVRSCETTTASPPKLELGDVPPSEEELSVECDTLIHIAEEDDASNTTVCSAASSGGASENVKQLEPAAIGSGDEAPLVEEEDFNYDFLHDDEEWSDDEDEVAVPIGELRRAHSLGAVQGKGTPQSQFSSLLGPAAVSYTHLTLPTTYACRSRWSPYH